MLGTLKAQYLAKNQGDRPYARIDFKLICFKIGALAHKLWPKEEKIGVSKRYGGEMFSKIHCSGRNPQKYSILVQVITNVEVCLGQLRDEILVAKLIRYRD